MAILELRGVDKRFGAVTVADGVTFDVGEADALGIIGPNGAGKSSLFNLITGNLPADGGQIRFLGVDVTHVSAMRRCHAGMGLTFQIPQPFQQLTVFENLLVGAAFGSGRSEAQVSRRCAEILEETGLVDRANQPAGSLSLLQRKRLELARALATEPKILLLDEIAGGLTEHECGALVETIRSIHRSGVAIVWIEHVLHALNAVVDRLLVLDFGKIIGIGPVEEIMASRAVRDVYLGIEV